MSRSPSPAAPGARRWWIGGLAVGMLCGMLACWPAAWALGWLETGGRVRFVSVEGSLWRGSAVVALTDGVRADTTLALPGRLHWHLLPAWGRHGPALAAYVSHDTAMPQPARLLLDANGIELTQARAQAPAAWLAGLGAPWNTVQLSGLLQLRAEALRLRRVSGQWRPDGRLEVNASRIGSRLSSVSPLGDYQLLLEGDGLAPGRLSLRTLAGELQLSGEGNWTGSRLQFRGEGRAAPGRQAALQQLLGLLGRYRRGVAELRIG